MTFERDAIEQWLRSGHDTSPVTNVSLAHVMLVPNRALKSAIEGWRKANADLAEAEALAKAAAKLAKETAAEQARLRAEDEARRVAEAKAAAEAEAEAEAHAVATAAAERHNALAAVHTATAADTQLLIVSGRQTGRRAECMGVYERLARQERHGMPVFQHREHSAHDSARFLYWGGDRFWYVGPHHALHIGHGASSRAASMAPFSVRGTIATCRRHLRELFWGRKQETTRMMITFAQTGLGRLGLRSIPRIVTQLPGSIKVAYAIVAAPAVT